MAAGVAATVVAATAGAALVTALVGRVRGLGAVRGIGLAAALVVLVAALIGTPCRALLRLLRRPSRRRCAQKSGPGARSFQTQRSR